MQYQRLALEEVNVTFITYITVIEKRKNKTDLIFFTYVQTRVTVHIAVFMYKFKNQLLPTNFNVFFFTSIKETHNYNTRLSSRMTYALPKTRTK